VLTSGRRVAIVARSPTSRYHAPFADPSWEVWTCSPQTGPRFCDLPRWDRWYELHHLTHQACENPGYEEWCAAQGDKLWLREPSAQCHHAHVYPLDGVLSACSAGWADPFRYFNNSVSLMLGHALFEGADAIGIWGVDMCQTSEYSTQRPSCEALLGYAAGRGITVHVPHQCDLLKTQRIYGIEDAGPWEQKLAAHENEIETRLHRSLDELNYAKKQVVGSAAAHGELSAVAKQLNGQAPEIKTLLENRLGQLVEVGKDYDLQSRTHDEQVKLYTGALEEIRYQRQFI